MLWTRRADDTERLNAGTRGNGRGCRIPDKTRGGFVVCLIGCLSLGLEAVSGKEKFQYLFGLDRSLKFGGRGTWVFVSLDTFSDLEPW